MSSSSSQVNEIVASTSEDREVFSEFDFLSEIDVSNKNVYLL